MARAFFQAYHSYLEAMEPLTDEECGRLFRALLRYSAGDEVGELCGNERFVFPSMRQQIDRDARSYDEKCERNRRNGALGGTRKAQLSSERYRTPPKEKEKEKAKEKKKEKDVVFVPPTPRQVREYCTQRSNTVDPDKFVDYYEANGWRLGSNSVRDWKALVRSWERKEPGGQNPFLREDV